ncbi:MAG TPA: STAS domain-containing protein [Terracidiphilus sp.]|jgi:anti-anti-sigma factor|nr:STAS domain-containing protein [Terracidiphilus sp.]
MNSTLINPATMLLIEPAELHELVRGQEQVLVERLKPVVERQSTTLDLARVERIDAAGIAALIALYRCAQRAGHQFNVANATHHVAEILAIVGLDRILLSCTMDPASPSQSHFTRTAA